MKVPVLFCRRAAHAAAATLLLGLAGAAAARTVNGCDIAPGTICAEANLADARLHEADLARANFLQSDLSGADLGGANLREADLRGAILQNARLRGADLRGARFDASTDLAGADTLGCRGCPAPAPR